MGDERRFCNISRGAMKLDVGITKRSDEMATKLFLSGDEIFYSIQGEGQNIGTPSVFLRLCFCNLECRWCDTKYAQKPVLKNGQERFLTVDQILKVIQTYPVKKIVITGGEPLIQQKALAVLLNKITDWDVEIETNGTIKPSAVIVARCKFNVSPKLSSSGNKKEKCFKPEILKYFNKFTRTSFKFVVASDTDIAEIEKIIKLCKLDPDKIIIMPEGTRKEKMIDDTRRLAEIAKLKGWRLIPRLHILLWGKKRKV